MIKQEFEIKKDPQKVFPARTGRGAKVSIVKWLAVCLVFSALASSIFAQPEKIVNPGSIRVPRTTAPELVTIEKPDFPAEKITEAGKVSANPIPDSFIIFFNEDVLPPYIKQSPATERDNRDAKADDAKKYEQKMMTALGRIAREKLGINPEMITEYYTTATTGIKVRIKNEEARRLLEKLKDVKEVAALIQDFEITAIGNNVKPTSNFLINFSQTPSWGVKSVGSGDYYGNKWAWVLDTGIDTTHPDLNVLTSPTFAASFISGESFVDGHGHGTHVAGIIAAKNNTIGILGVAAGAAVVPVKVLSNSGKGAYSSLLSGLNHVAKYYLPGDVVNMSLGGPAPDWFTDAFIWFDPRKQAENAVRNLGGVGVYCVMAAGNDGIDANKITPGRINGTRLYTISAMDSNRNIAGFSNYGNPPVDFTAPGVGVLSTYKGGRYVYMDGTSMAAPFVSGILLINNGFIRTSGILNVDKDALRDAIAIK